MADQATEAAVKAAPAAQGSLAVQPPSPDTGLGDIVDVLERKLIKRADLQMEVPGDRVDETGRKIVTLVEMSRGFVQRSVTFTEDGKYRGMNFTLRVPEEKFASVLGELESLGKVLSRSIDSEDVTERYIDTQAQLKNKERQEQRLLEIMGKANNVGELMQVENELNRVRSEIDMLKGRLKYLEGATSYSTITVTVREARDGVVGPILPGFWDDVWQAFMRTFKNMAICLARLAPYAMLIGAVWLIYGKLSRGKAAGK
jgi:hypothetical protein